MGLDVYVKTFFAIEVSRSLFFFPTGETKLVCPEQPKDHSVAPDAKFCDQCGTKTEIQQLEAPSPSFLAFCQGRDASPDRIFNQLQSDGFRWTDSSGASYVMGLHQIQSIGLSNQTPHIQLGLGIRLQRSTSHRYCFEKNEVIGYSASDLEKLAPAIIGFAHIIVQLIGTPKLYSQAYCSH